MSNFKIIHWNTLADSLSNGFPYVDKSYIIWKHRKDLIINKVKQENADIICLVEIDNKDQNMFDKLYPTYSKYYVKKDSEDNHEGCLVLINNNSFTVLTQTAITLKKGRSQIAIILKLQNLNNKYILNLVSTHLKAKPGWEETRLEQCKTIMDVIGNEDCIFTGDFNDVPGSLCYQYLTEEQKFTDIYLQCNKGNRKYTTFKKREKVVCRVIDYIFYRSKTLKPATTIDAPDMDTLPEIGLPTKEHPSDHILIGGIFI